jgi:hypothetical protein
VKSESESGMAWGWTKEPGENYVMENDAGARRALHPDSSIPSRRAHPVFFPAFFLTIFPAPCGIGGWIHFFSEFPMPIF